MAVSKLPNGKWQCQCFPDGRNGRRVRRQFTTKGEAMAYERQLMQKQTLNIDTSNVQRLSELVNRWYELHGKTLKDGDARKSKLEAVCERLNNPLVTDFDKNMFAVYREERLNGKWNAKGRKSPSQSTVNREQSYLHAVFSELTRLGEWEGENPLNGIRQFRESEQELAFLYPGDIKRLLAECDNSANKDLGHVVRLCLATGARWGEAQSLTQSQLMKYKVTYIKTKGNKNRTIPISQRLYDRLPKKRGRLFGNCYDAFENAVKRADIDLPDGQQTHVLRHTFASHFMMSGGNILVLQRILGHSTINMTMRYAHFAPDHLDLALTLNPYDQIEEDN
ncbi:phage integrase [Xenorhabdus bovienii]|uniref:phage integrase n=1 Tax=Xenorhabdus bovienii TaxID=40576 RepID=UPI0023B2CE65|nr:tyrosine-type recombinase/integrase [Xenorhabdus bovienii]MDE9455742.1 tyrosine-type recombinase/integrase [Xenorhabdus bovienii]MDE9553259.1 tyrosine-type recombinase/integrase [Xenorhabdus bovienii]MDE9565491.1 tyrosine-type recombinase/integrase [Xenorhabdus bovienii]